MRKYMLLSLCLAASVISFSQERGIYFGFRWNAHFEKFRFPYSGDRNFYSDAKFGHLLGTSVGKDVSDRISLVFETNYVWTKSEMRYSGESKTYDNSTSPSTYVLLDKYEEIRDYDYRYLQIPLSAKYKPFFGSSFYLTFGVDYKYLTKNKTIVTRDLEVYARYDYSFGSSQNEIEYIPNPPIYETVKRGLVWVKEHRYGLLFGLGTEMKTKGNLRIAPEFRFNFDINNYESLKQYMFFQMGVGFIWEIEKG